MTHLPPADKTYTAPRKQIWGWGAGRVAEFGLIATFGQAMNIFTVGFGLSPVIVSWCMMLPRLVDGLLDPMIGHWSDETHTRWGRRKPFLLGGAVLGAFFLAILWWADPAWSHQAQFLYLGITGMFLYLCYGAYAMAWNAVGYELSDDYHERARIAAVGGLFLAAMGLLNNWIYWIALRPSFGGLIWGMRWIGLAMAVLVIVSAIITTFTVKERFTHTTRTHVALLPAIRTTLHNRPFVILLLMKVFEIFGGRLTGGLSFFLMVYYVCRGDQDLATKIGGIGATLGTVWNFAVLPLIKPTSKWIGKRGALISGAAVGLLAAIVAPFITTPEHPYWGLIPTLIITPILVISSTIAGAILPDICDLDELETGQRREGLFTSVMGFVSKLEISLAVVLVGYVVSWSAVDTKIGMRWMQAAAKPEVIEFPAGESAVYQLSEQNGVVFDKLSLAGSAREVELHVSDASATEGYRAVDLVRTGDSTDSKTWGFAPVTAKFVKIVLKSGENSGQITLGNLSLTSSDGTNLLAPAAGAKLAAAKPPEPVVIRLFWFVMIPGIIFSALTLMMTILFPLTEAKMLEVRQQLDALRSVELESGIPRIVSPDKVAE